MTPEKRAEKIEWDKRVKERAANGTSGNKEHPQTSADKAAKLKPLCNAFMLGKCTKGNDCPNHHPKALTARINKQVNKSIGQGTNLLKKPTTVAPGEASTQVGSSSNAQPKVQARPKKPGE